MPLPFIVTEAKSTPVIGPAPSFKPWTFHCQDGRQTGPEGEVLTQGLQEIPFDLGSICQSSLHMVKILGSWKVVRKNRNEHIGSVVEQGFFLVEQFFVNFFLAMNWMGPLWGPRQMATYREESRSSQQVNATVGPSAGVHITSSSWSLSLNFFLMTKEMSTDLPWLLHWDTKCCWVRCYKNIFLV